MFKELGYKLKFAAYCVYALCLAMLVILGVFMILQGNLFGYVVAFSSVFVAWIPAAITYAIGEMYEKIMYQNTEVPKFLTKAQKEDIKSEEELQKLQSLQNLKNSQTVPEYDKIKQLKQLQAEKAKTKKIKINDKYEETDC